MIGDAAVDLATAWTVVVSLWWAVNSAWTTSVAAPRVPDRPPELPKPAAVMPRASADARRDHKENSEVFTALITSGIFKKTSPDIVMDWCSQLEPVHYPARHIIVKDGNFAGCIYVIVAGKVKVCRRRPDSCDVVLNILGSSDVLGAITLFTSAAHDLSATTLTEVVAVPIKRAQLCQWMTEHPEIRDQMLRLLARWAKTMTNFLFDYAYADAQTRVASRLLFLKKRFGRREGDVVRVVHDLGGEDLSFLTGVASDEVCEILQSFEQLGWIRLEDNSVLIMNAQALAGVQTTSRSAMCHV
jgi:CRP/FNR family transcriptional regulator, cyclic AMP receptor protein